MGNAIINTFTTAFAIVKDTWSLLPEAFVSIFTKAMNAAISTVETGINTIIGRVGGAQNIAQLNAIKPTGIGDWRVEAGRYGMTVCGVKK